MNQMTEPVKLPQEPGDYFWYTLYDCNCCISNYGALTVYIYNGIDTTRNAFIYTNEKGQLLHLVWIGRPPMSTELENGNIKYIIDNFVKCDITPSKDPSIIVKPSKYKETL